MARYFASHWRTYRREAIGLALFFTWVYCTLFGCGLVTSSYVHWGLEHFWGATGVAEAAVALVALALSSRLRERCVRPMIIVACCLAIAGTCAIWLAYFDHTLFWGLRVVAAVCCGTAIVIMSVGWGARLCTYNESEIEFAVPASFVIAFALYCVLLLSKVASVPVLLFDCIFPVLSAYFLLRNRPQASRGRETKLGVCDCGDEPISPEAHATNKADLMSLLVLVAFLWFQIAYFRVIATPDELGNRYWHFLVPFFCSGLIAFVLFVFCIRLSRYANFTLMFRWALPLSLISYALLFIDYGNPTQRIFAYTVNFAGMFGVQFGCWMAAPKYLRRSRESALVMFLGIAVAEGIGIAAGCMMSLFLIGTLDVASFMNVSVFVMAAVIGVAMAVGFNPRWLFNRMPDDGGACAQDSDERSVLDDERKLAKLFGRQARDLQLRYGLTDRETEVTALLLAGRNRPYIRDELVVSLNTVHAHARSIFQKCNVHSQQDLMDLALHQEEDATMRTKKESIASSRIRHRSVR